MLLLLLLSLLLLLLLLLLVAAVVAAGMTGSGPEPPCQEGWAAVDQRCTGQHAVECTAAA
jgi:hypothetical protein